MAYQILQRKGKDSKKVSKEGKEVITNAETNPTNLNLAQKDKKKPVPRSNPAL